MRKDFSSQVMSGSILLHELSYKIIFSVNILIYYKIFLQPLCVSSLTDLYVYAMMLIKTLRRMPGGGGTRL